MKGLRFRKSIKILPGLRANIGMRGVSISAGVKGARITAGSRGVHATGGLPGTGVSVTRKLSGESISNGSDEGTASPLAQTIPGVDVLRIAVMMAGVFGMLIGVTAGMPPVVALSWLITWIGLFLVLRGQSAVVRVGGGFVGSLLLMVGAISCS